MKTPDSNRMNHNGDGFASRDAVYLGGSVDNLGTGLFSVNGREVEVNTRKCLVLLVLFSHSLALAGRQTPIKVSLSPYLSAAMILEAVTKFIATLNPRPNAFGSFPTDTDIIKVINQIRESLDRRHLNRHVIEQGPNGRGYRLGMDANLIRLSFVWRPGENPTEISGG